MLGSIGATEVMVILGIEVTAPVDALYSYEGEIIGDGFQAERFAMSIRRVSMRFGGPHL